MGNDIENIYFFGASRGLGLECFKYFFSQDRSVQSSALSFFLLSRNAEKDFLNCTMNGQEVSKDKNCKIFNKDFTKAGDHEYIFNLFKENPPTRVFYFAGGGPYGEFASKEWKDHLWAYKLNLLFPAHLAHELLSSYKTKLKQIVFVGSAIAEDKPDVKASSYASAKHGLLGFVKTLVLEYPQVDIRLYSPGYMDTSMLPKNANPRQSASLLNPVDVANDLSVWCESKADKFHRVYS